MRSFRHAFEYRLSKIKAFVLDTASYDPCYYEVTHYTYDVDLKTVSQHSSCRCGHEIVSFTRQKDFMLDWLSSSEIKTLKQKGVLYVHDRRSGRDEVHQ